MKEIRGSKENEQKDIIAENDSIHSQKMRNLLEQKPPSILRAGIPSILILLIIIFVIFRKLCVNVLVF